MATSAHRAASRVPAVCTAGTVAVAQRITFPGGATRGAGHSAPPSPRIANLMDHRGSHWIKSGP